MLGFSREISPALIDVFYCEIFYLILIWMNYKFCVFPDKYTIKKSRQYTFLILAAFFTITAFASGDFYHYKGLVEYRHSMTSGDENHMEDIYTTVLYFCNRNYFYFRVIVFGGAITLSALAMKGFTNSFYYPLFFLIATCSTSFSYSRSSLAFACYFYGLYHIIYLIRNRNSITSHLIIGGIFIFLSMEFHRSAMLLLVLFPIIFLPIRKNTILIIFLLFSLLVFILGEFFESMYYEKISTDDMINERLSQLTTFSRSGASLQQTVRRFFNYGSILIPFIIITKYYVISFDKIPIVLSDLYKVTLGIILFSISTLTLGFDNTVLFYRTLYMAIIPVICLFYSFYENGIIPPLTYKRLLLFGIIGEILQRMYSVYFTYSGFVA